MSEDELWHYVATINEMPEPPLGKRISVKNPSGETVNGFLVRNGQGVRGFVNRCVHMDLELDWNPGLFFDVENQYLMCATHGALYDPVDGRCVDGPCQGGRLQPLLLQLNGQEIFVRCS